MFFPNVNQNLDTPNFINVFPSINLNKRKFYKFSFHIWNSIRSKQTVQETDPDENTDKTL